MPVDEVARRLKKSADAIQAWEAGTDSPTYCQLESLAYKVYKRPIAVFFFSEPPDVPRPRNSFRTLPETELEELSPQFMRIYNKAIAMQIGLGELNEGVNPASRRILEELHFGTWTDARQMAAEVRQYLGIDLQTQMAWRGADKAFKEWRGAVEHKGVFVFKDAFKQDDISGFCLADPTFPMIYINNSTPHTRQVFTLFHELAHLLLGTGGITKIDETYLRGIRGENRQIEVLCSRFTAEFLVPDEDFSRHCRVHVSDQTIQDLSDRYSVSREVILRKLYDRGLVGRSEYERKSQAWIADAQMWRPYGKAGDYYRNQAVYLGDTYMALVFRKLYQGQISQSDAAEYLGVKADHLAGLEEVFLHGG